MTRNPYNYIAAADLTVVLASQSALSPEQVTALQAEVETDPEELGLASAASPAALLLLLNSPYSKPNPVTTAPRVPLTSLTKDQFKPLRTTIASNWASADNPPKEALRDLVKEVLPALAEQDGVDLTNAKVAEGLANLQNLGVLSAAEVEALTTIPDPTWQAQVVMPSRASVRLGDTELLYDLSDLIAAGLA